MIDFIKSYNCSIDKSLLLENQKLNFPIAVDPNSWEVLKKNRYSEYNGITFSIFTSGSIGMAGSLHKYFNNGDHNYNDFRFPDLIFTIIDLFNRFGINPLNVMLNNIEFGVNIELGYNPKDLIDSLVAHRYKPFNIESNSKILYAQAKYENYVLKIYDKGLQQGLNNHIIRIEVKVLRMAYLAKTGIKNLWDLSDRKKLNYLKEILVEAVDEILFCEKIPEETKLSKKDLQLLTEGSNPKFWAKHLEEAGNNASKKMRKYKELIRNNGEQNFHRITDLIKQKCDSLLEVNSETIRLLTEFQDNLINQNVRVLTEIPSAEVTDHLLSSKEEVTTFNNSSKMGKVISPLKSKMKVCAVTGLDISMQKDESRFLCSTGIRYQYENNRSTYQRLLSELPQKWQKAPLKIQEYKIAHHVRDKFFNPRNHTRRAIKKLCSEPALFDNTKLISDKKWKIANTP